MKIYRYIDKKTNDIGEYRFDDTGICIGFFVNNILHSKQYNGKTEKEMSIWLRDTEHKLIRS